MATAQLIDLSNYSTLLTESTQSRSGTPDGNVFFNTTTGDLELIGRNELAQVDLGSGLEDNPLDNSLGITFQAIYAAENLFRRNNETLRQFQRWTKGSFADAGAFELIKSRKIAAVDRPKVRGSGWIERSLDDGVDRIYFGARSLGTGIQASSQPYYQTALGGAPTDFGRTGPVNEAIQVFGSTANSPSDATAGNFDNRSYFAMSIRTFGFNHDRKTLADSGIDASDGFAAGFALDETPHLTTGTYTLADVYGGAQVAPFTGLSLEKLATPQTETGFAQADGNFTWVLNNTLNASLDECVAFLDALAGTDDDIDSGTETVTNGKRVNTWYYYNSSGQIVFRSGADSLGLFVENIPTADAQRCAFTADDASIKTRPFKVQVEIDPGSFAIADVLAFYHVYYSDGAGGLDFGTANAVTVIDDNSNAVKGNVSTDVVTNKIIFTYDYDGNTDAGLSAGTDKEMVAIVEGDGGATQAQTTFTVTRSAVVPVTCAPGQETNV